ncbi:alpha/beta hydrolase [Chitiniphilus eburneus]|uniref:Alpha/beta fold hydrolase n=1 Tax=Chitiniphilus eburneus TaxID=2571148 RepID=A0A4U0Q5G7_9NEIS|nr:alpha/beta fold hydrolase [Chitiniphilus eburneus]TJZ76325.1 alpha/beta fold hydrolase [Chitiniphilus eburneus]
MNKWLNLMLIALVACGSSQAWAASKKPKQATVVVPAVQEEAPPEFAKVSFTTEDGVPLAGRVFGKPGAAWVILSHQHDRDQTAWERFAARLADEGYTVLTYDFRGYGDSGGQRVYAQLDRDLKAAVAYARAQGADKVALMGACIGSIATVPAAAATKPQAVVLMTFISSFEGLKASDDDLKAIAAPKLFVAARYDGTMDSVMRMESAAADPKQLLISESGGRGPDMFVSRDGEETQQKIVAFLKQAVPTP